MATAKKLPSGSWRVLVYAGTGPDGKRKYESFTAETKREAEFLAAEWMARHAGEKKPGRLTLREAARIYIDQREGVLSPSTINGYKKITSQYFQGIMDAPLKSIKEQDLQIAVQQESMRQSAITGKPLAPKTIRSAFAFILTVLDINGISINSKRIRLPQPKKAAYSTPDGNALAQIFRATYGTQIEIPVLLAAWLTLRMSEIVALKWDCVHEDHIEVKAARIYVPGGSVEKATKTEGSTRRIPLPSYIRTRMDALPRSSEYVVPLTGQAIGKRFTRILEEAGIPHCRFHDLRHAAASIMLLLNIPDKYAMARGGWTTDHVYKSVYQQTFSAEELLIAQQIDNHYSSIIASMQHEMQHEK